MKPTTSSKGAPHILLLPFPAQGHILPLLDLAHHLAIHGFTITILVTPKNLPILTPLLSASAAIHPLVLPFPAPHPSLPSAVENIKDIGNHANVFLINALAQLRDPIISWFNSQSHPPLAFISDFFLGWAHSLAHQLGVPSIAFFSTAALLTAVLDHLWSTSNNHHLRQQQQQEVVVTFSHMPRSPTFTWDHLPSVFRRYTRSDPEWELVKDSMVANSRSSWGYVVNTFDALEPDYLDFLKKDLGHDRVFGVGPLSLLGPSDPITRGGVSTVPVTAPDGGVLSWLDGLPDAGSVLYVCFGSQRFMSDRQIEALAIGLERSGVKFVWVVKATGSGGLPYGFEERVSDRGVVIKGWAPQVAILGHRAVGGFLSHCGWNSVLEGIVGGVMFLAWPMEADQYINARLLVDYQGIGVRVCEGPDTVPDPDELARAISESMVTGDMIEMVRAKKMKIDAVEAVGEGGSSRNELDRLVREFNQLVAPKT